MANSTIASAHSVETLGNEAMRLAKLEEAKDTNARLALWMDILLPALQPSVFHALFLNDTRSVMISLRELMIKYMAGLNADIQDSEVADSQVLLTWEMLPETSPYPSMFTLTFDPIQRERFIDDWPAHVVAKIHLAMFNAGWRSWFTNHGSLRFVKSTPLDGAMGFVPPACSFYGRCQHRRYADEDLS